MEESSPDVVEEEKVPKVIRSPTLPADEAEEEDADPGKIGEQRTMTNVFSAEISTLLHGVLAGRTRSRISSILLDLWLAIKSVPGVLRKVTGTGTAPVLKNMGVLVAQTTTCTSVSGPRTASTGGTGMKLVVVTVA